MRGLALVLMMMTAAIATPAQAAQLTIERIFDGSSLSGPTPIKLKTSPDGTRVTFLRAKADDQNTFDLWEYNVSANEIRLLVDSARLQPAREQLSDAEKARRERARIAGRHGIVDYQWSPDGEKLLFPLGVCFLDFFLRHHAPPIPPRPVLLSDSVCTIDVTAFFFQAGCNERLRF